MVASPIRIEGLEDIRRLIDEGNRKVIKAAATAVTEVTNDVARKADELVPFDTGALAGSQVITYPKTTGRNKLIGEVAYGGVAAPYAVVQHENVNLWHPPKPPGKSKVGGRSGVGKVQPGQGRGPKFLEFPLKRARKDFDKTIVNRIKALIR